MTMQQSRKPVKKKSTETAAATQPDNGTPAAPVEQPPQPQISVMAIVALVLSAFGILLIPGILGLILATVAMWQINRSEGRLIGRELAIAALTLSTVLLIYHLIFLGAVSAVGAATGFLIGQINDFFNGLAGIFR
ncbi:MAG: hypothetical protein CMO74_03115 [Verrucomicrobiales bacterium]|nr:hypothetical protein [Verrucomicrobiales bacterium]|tara:strand:+ start:1974 stop:2378 length:405 start_codon:yes stop_codon:yes gene_type:complete